MPSDLAIEPFVSWPAQVTVGRPFPVVVDLRAAAAPGSSSVPQEYVFSCYLRATSTLRVQTVAAPRLVLRADGRAQRPARFQVTAFGSAGPRTLLLAFCTRRGVQVRTDELPVSVVDASPTILRPPARPDPPPKATRGRATADAPVPEYDRRLVVQLEEDPLDRNRFALTVWGVSHDGPLTLAQADEPLDLRGVEERLASTVRGSAWHDDTPMEFILPTALLSLPVDTWVFRDGLTARRWGMRRPVYVRSLAAIRARERHGDRLEQAWLRRWRQISTSQAAGLELCRWATDDSQYALPGTFSRLDQVPCLALDLAPGERSLLNQNIIGSAVGSMIPIILWPRTAAAVAGFRQAIRGLLTEGQLRDLLSIVWYLRRAAATSADPNHPGNHTTLYWDAGGPHPVPQTRLHAPR